MMRPVTDCWRGFTTRSLPRWKACPQRQLPKAARRIWGTRPDPPRMSTRQTAHQADSPRPQAAGQTRIFSRIACTGSYLPPRRVSNQELVDQLAADGVASSDTWIVERTGIRARHFAEPDVTSSTLGLRAAQAALDAAGCQAADIDLIVCATSTPDLVFPATACLIQRDLGIHGCPAFDVQAVCSGFIYALTVADAMIRCST